MFHLMNQNRNYKHFPAKFKPIIKLNCIKMIYIYLMLHSVKLENITPVPAAEPVVDIKYDPFEHQMSGMMRWLPK